MRVPLLRGLIERRILVNYRADPAVVARRLPPPFAPQQVAGQALVGICLIRLAAVRPAWLPGGWGLASENAAHRFAVEWEEAGQRRRGVYVERRDTSLWLNALVGGRLFPGEHHQARFQVAETDDRFEVSFRSDDGSASLSVAATVTDRWPADSVFPTLAAASDFFAAGAVGYSATARPGRFDGLELRCDAWRVEPLAVEAAASSVFDDPALFPPGSIALDNALLMRNIAHQWRGLAPLCCREGREADRGRAIAADRPMR